LPDDGRFYIYSITKTLLAAMTLQLVAFGEIGLDRAVQEYLPDYPLETPVTVRQVLGHTAGLPDYGGMPEYAAAVRATPEVAWSSEEFLERTLGRGLQFAPDEGWAYSNIGYLTIRMLVERVTELTLRELVARQIVTPLGLVATTVAETLDDTAMLTPGFSGWIDPDGPAVDSSRRYHPGWVSHGVVISTGPELARIIDAVFDGRLVPPALLPDMLRPTRVPMDHPLFAEPSYGLGVMLDPGSPYGVIAGHGGGGPGYSAGALHFPAVGGRRVTTVALANWDMGDVGLPIAYGLVDVVPR
ncbi:MAG TPA: serine hydrolase domain-containing protein, partial [Thermomicrobiales bacterium]|nr:serine hydrolase domain-containing protein [Thermomicrobiales bacterium]